MECEDGAVISGKGEASAYSGTVLSSSADIARLDPIVRALMPDLDVTLTPTFVLASLGENWSPRVVVVHRDGGIVGIVYAKERMVAGFRTGLIYGDGRLGNLLVAQPEHCDAVMRTAIASWFGLPRLHGVRLAISPASPEARTLAAVHSSTFDLTRDAASSAELHCALALPSDYETFLGTLGHRTRRNFRYYRRRFEAAGHRYLDQLSPGDLDRAASDLRSKCSIPSSASEIRRAVGTVLSTDDPWIVGLKHSNGEWLSVSAGWWGPSGATMFLQVNNDRQFGDASLSVVLRGYLIETLIGKRAPQLIFWSGSASPLSRYVRPIPALAVHLDAQTAGWRFVRAVVGITEPLIGKWITEDVRWMVGSRH